MSTIHNEESVKRVFTIYNIGVVSRVDFTPIDKKPGFVENINEFMKSAFIHFSNMPTMLGNVPSYPYNEDFWHLLISEGHVKLHLRNNEFWICLKNNNPIKNTLMNIHQVVENGRHLENLIQEQAKKIEEQAQTIKELSEKLENIHNVVYQMLGVTDNCKMLTTIEGDDYEQRIAKMENILGIDNEEQDALLLGRKNTFGWIDDDSERMTEEQIERERAWREEDRYNDMCEEAKNDKASDFNRI